MNRINSLLCLCLLTQTSAFGASALPTTSPNDAGSGVQYPSETSSSGATDPPRGDPGHVPFTTPVDGPNSGPESSTSPVLPAGTRVHQTSGTAATTKPDANPAMSTERPRLTLILAGGGARGAVHIGVLKVLEAEGIHPASVTGSSVGSMIGALYSAGVPISRIEEMALNGELKKAYMPTPLLLQTAKFVSSYSAKRLLFMKPAIAVYSGKSIETFMNRNLPPNRRRIEQFPLHFSAIATNDLDTRPVWISQGDAAQAVRASSAVPVMYAPVQLNGKSLIDGGVRANLPTDKAPTANAPIVVAVRCYSDLEAVKDQKSLNTVYCYADRVVALLFAEVEAKATANADIVIEPKIGSMHIYSFDRGSMQEAIAAGEAATRKLIPQIKNRLQMTDGTAMVAPN